MGVSAEWAGILGNVPTGVQCTTDIGECAVWSPGVGAAWVINHFNGQYLDGPGD